MSRLDFPERADTFGISKANLGNGRLYKTYFPNHDENVVSMLAKISSGDDTKQELMTVDSRGGLTIVNIDPLSTSLYKCRTVDLFYGMQLTFTCCDYNSSSRKLYMGTIKGDIWETNLDSVKELNTGHTAEVTAIVSTHSTLYSAGKDRVVRMYDLEMGSLITMIISTFDICFLNIFTSIRGCPVAVADSSGCVSIWSPHKMRRASDRAVQNVCNLNEQLVALFHANVFNKTAMVCVTSGWVRIWSVSTAEDGKEALSVLNDEVLGLMRSIQAPDRLHFTTACALHGDVSSLLTGCSDGSIVQWEPTSGAQIRRFDVTAVPSAHVLYIQSEQVIVSCDQNNTLCVLDPCSTPCVSQLGPVSSAPVTCAAACEVSRTVIAVGDADGRVFKYDGAKISTASRPSESRHAVTAIEVMVSQISKYVVVIAGFANGLIDTYIFNGTDITENTDFSTATKSRTHAYDSPVTFIRNADDDRVVTACENGDTILWNVTIGVSTRFEKIKVLDHCGQVNCIGINPRNDIFVMGSRRGDLLLWDTKSWTEITSVKGAHDGKPVRSVGFMFNQKKLSRYVVSIGAEDSLVKCWKLKANKLVLESTIELPAICERAEVWGREESSLLFVQTKTGLLYVLDILRNSLGPLRFFSNDETACSFWQVCGTRTAMFIDVDDATGKVNVWNNNLTAAESTRARVSSMFGECLLESRRVSPKLDAVLRSHPLFPSCLLETDPTCGSRTLFSKAILGKFSHFVTTYLPAIPAAVVQTCLFRGKPRSLLWLALKMKDYESVDCIVQIWAELLVAESDRVELSVFSTAELMVDLKVLCRELPAKFADLITRLSIPRNHVINAELCHSRFIRHGNYWMRGSALRTVRGFWSHVQRRAYPDLATRRLEPAEEGILQLFDAPHATALLQMPSTAAVESSKRLPHPSIRSASTAAAPGDSIVVDEWDEDDGVRLGKVNRKQFAPERGGGGMVQAYVHPVPYAAAGTEFLRLCQRSAGNTGHNDVMCSPAVAAVLDYKWHTYFKDLHHAALFHYSFVLVLFTLHCIYFDLLMDSPAVSGLPVLALVAACFLLLSFILLLAQECITFMSSYVSPTRRMWFVAGVVAYVIAITGLSMQLRAATFEVHMSSSFSSRSVLSVATIFLYFKCLNYMTPVDFIGPLVYRVLFTISSTIHYFIVILMALAAFATCFNLQFSRREQDVPVDSFYGSLMQVLFMATGGFDMDFVLEADSPLFTSVFLIAFVLFVILIFLVILISATSEAYSLSFARAQGAWRAEQARVILQKSFLLPDEENLKPFHNPKWLHILAPVGVIEAFRGRGVSAGAGALTGHPALFGGGSGAGGRGGCDRDCDCEHPVDISGPTAKFISKEVDDIQDMLSELNNRIAAKTCVDVNVLADKVAGKLMETINALTARSSFRSPRAPEGPVPVEYLTVATGNQELSSGGEEEEEEEMVEEVAASVTPRASPVSSPTKSPSHLSIRIRSIKSSKKKFSRQISSHNDNSNSDDENDEKARQFYKDLQADLSK